MADEHLQHLMQLIEAKQVYTSYALLRKMPADTYVPGKQKILDELKSTLVKGKAIHAILQNNRNNGDYPAALTQGLRLQKIVPDYPNLKQDIAAIQAALKKLSSTVAQAKIAANHGRQKEVIKLLQTIRQIHADHSDIKIIEKTVQRRVYTKRAQSILIATIIIVLPCLLFGAEKIMVWRAQENLTIASHLIANNEFKQAQKAFTKMHRNLRFIYIFNNVEKKDLMRRATALQSSRAFTQGIRGKVVHKGAFINKKKKNIIHKLEVILGNANRFATEKNWQNALDKYNEALVFSQQNEAEIGNEQGHILEKIAILQQQQNAEEKQLITDDCLLFIGQAQEAALEENWPLAKTKYEAAFALMNQAEIEQSCTTADDSKLYNIAVLTILLEKGDDHKNQQQPVEAINVYRQAIAYANENNMEETTILELQAKIDSLEELTFISQVQQLIAEGDALVAQGDPSAGLSKYNFSLTMLDNNTSLIKGKNQFSASLIKKIASTEKQVITISHTSHLKAVAETDLRQYFNLSPQDKLGQASITLRNHKDNLYTYKVSAMSVRDKIKYELLYQRNETTERWQILK